MEKNIIKIVAFPKELFNYNLFYLLHFNGIQTYLNWQNKQRRNKHTFHIQFLSFQCCILLCLFIYEKINTWSDNCFRRENRKSLGQFHIYVKITFFFLYSNMFCWTQKKLAKSLSSNLSKCFVSSSINIRIIFCSQHNIGKVYINISSFQKVNYNRCKYSQSN